MSESDIQIILHRLDEMEKMLIEIRDESKKTNGRVNDLELESEHRSIAQKLSEAMKEYFGVKDE